MDTIYLLLSQVLAQGVTLQIMGTIARSVLQRGTCHKSNRKEGNGQQGLWPKNRAGKEIFKTSTTNKLM